MKRCKDYVGITCVDGSCPMANKEEYEERCIPTINKCEECPWYKGCEDCAIYDICDKKEKYKHGYEK